MRIEKLLAELWDAPIGRLKDRAAMHGATNPVGDGDAKTASPGTYRPVGQTCPASCPYLGAGCYAEGGNVRMHQVRASDRCGPSVRAAAVAMVWAARTDRLARLHVSGDFLERGRIDRHYIDALIRIGRWIQQQTGRTIVAWSYTHIGPERFERFRTELLGAGIVVRYSDRTEGPGAVVWPHDDRAGIKVRFGKGAVRCPAQLSDSVSCDDCRLCSNPKIGPIVFDPHGASHKRIRASLKVIQ